MNFHISRDRPTGEPCQFHVWPSCHPAQVGPDDIYACRHRAWPAVRHGDFPPVVECGGDHSKCELVGTRPWHYYKRGLTQRVNHNNRRGEGLKGERRSVSFMEAAVKGTVIDQLAEGEEG